MYSGRLRNKYMGQVMEIELPKECGYKGYMVECRYKYNKPSGKYQLSMWLKQQTVDDTFKIDGQEIDTQLISGTRETIVENICRIVEQACMSGFFKHYIQHHQYTYKCCEVGMEVLESGQIRDGE